MMKALNAARSLMMLTMSVGLIFVAFGGEFPHRVVPIDESSAGFAEGIAHGFFSLVAAFKLAFTGEGAVFEVHNAGLGYDLGYFCGSTALIFAAAGPESLIRLLRKDYDDRGGTRKPTPIVHQIRGGLAVAALIFLGVGLASADTFLPAASQVALTSYDTNAFYGFVHGGTGIINVVVELIQGDGLTTFQAGASTSYQLTFALMTLVMVTVELGGATAALFKTPSPAEPEGDDAGPPDEISPAP